MQERWVERNLSGFQVVAKRHRMFTSDDIRQLEGGIIEKAPHQNCWGGLFRAAVLTGVCRATGGSVTSRRRKARHRRIQVWESLIS
jgi:hypothetical protein